MVILGLIGIHFYYNQNKIQIFDFVHFPFNRGGKTSDPMYGGSPLIDFNFTWQSFDLLDILRCWKKLEVEILKSITTPYGPYTEAHFEYVSLYVAPDMSPKGRYRTS